jgi:hypothetical protein
MEKASIEQLLESLKNPDRDIRFKATEMLWQRWFEQKGAIGLELLRRKVKSKKHIYSSRIRNCFCISR